MTLLWVPDEPAWESLMASRPQLAAAALPASADGALLGRWRREGLPFASPWQTVSLDDQLALAEEALALAEGWLAEAPALRFQDLDLAQLCRTALLYLLRDGLLAGRLAERILDSTAPADLAIAGDDIMAQVLRWAAHRRGLGLQDLGRAAAAPAAGLPPRRLLGALRQAVGWRAGAGRAPAGATVLVAGGGVDFLNQRPVVERLGERAPGRVLHLALHPPAMAGRAAAPAALPRPDRMLPAYASPGDYLALRALGRRAWRAFAEGRLPGLEPYPWLGDNRWLRPAFAQLFLEGLPRAGGAYGAARRLLGQMRPGLVLLSNAASPRERALILAAKRQGVPSVQLVHSGFNDLQVHQVLADELWVWGTAQAAQFAAAGLPAERIRALGNPAYDRPPAPARPREALGLGEADVVFLLVTARPSRLLAFIDPEGHAADLEAICAALAELPGTRLVIKPHPRYDDLALYRQLAGRWPGVTVVEDASLASLLALCDVALALNVGTTGGLEAVLADRPLVWIRVSSRYPSGFDLLEPGALTVTRHAEIAPALQELARSPAARAALAARGRAYRPGLLAIPEGQAADAVVAAIEERLSAG